MKSLDWAESAGGPFVMLPLTQLESWGGIENRDYDDACEISTYTGLLERNWGHVLVLGGEPLRTAFLQVDGCIRIVRWMSAPDESSVIQAVQGLRPGIQNPVERLVIQLETETYVLFDGAAPEGDDADQVSFRSRQGIYEIATYLVEQGETSLVVHTLDPSALLPKRRA